MSRVCVCDLLMEMRDEILEMGASRGPHRQHNGKRNRREPVRVQKGPPGRGSHRAKLRRQEQAWCAAEISQVLRKQ